MKININLNIDSQHISHIIEYIENPSEEIKLMAVKGNGTSIRYINDPSEEVKLTAVKQNGFAIQHIKNPSEEIKLAAIKQNIDTLRLFPKSMQTPSMLELIYHECIKDPSKLNSDSFISKKALKKCSPECQLWFKLKEE